MTTDAPIDELHGILVALPAAQRWRFLGELPKTFTMLALQNGHARGLWECEACQYIQVFVSSATHEAVNQIPCRHCDLAAQVQRVRESVIHLQEGAVEMIDAMMALERFGPAVLPDRGDVLRDVGLEATYGDE